MPLEAIAQQFLGPNHACKISPLGRGHINDTYLVTIAEPKAESRSRDSDRPQQFVLQRINRAVFPQPEWVVDNMQAFAIHARATLQQLDLLGDRRWEIPQVLAAGDCNCHIDTNGDVWRAIDYIGDSRTFTKLETPTQGQELGFALGLFHRLVQDLPSQALADTLPGFHITPQYLQQFDLALTQSDRPQSPELALCLDAIAERRAWASVLEDAKDSGILTERPIHGDPKVNNVLFDRNGDRAIALVDLDTVKPGLLHYDIGDCLRSGCNRLGGSTREFDRVEFDVELCRAILRGYLSQAKASLTEGDRHYLFDAIRLLPYELGLRYVADYLAGDRYFKVTYPDQNLDRARVQFQLLASVERQEQEIRAAIAVALE